MSIQPDRYDPRGRLLNVELKGLICGRPDEAAEVLVDQDIIDGSDPSVCYSASPEKLRMIASHFVGMILRGTTVLVPVPDQKTLNTLAGYFWVEPRRLPPPEDLHCDICGVLVEGGHRDLVTKRPRHLTCIPF